MSGSNPAVQHQSGVGFPQQSAPFTDNTFKITQAWQKLLFALWNKLGGTSSVNQAAYSQFEYADAPQVGQVVNFFQALNGDNPGGVVGTVIPVQTSGFTEQAIALGSSPHVFTATVSGFLIVDPTAGGTQPAFTFTNGTLLNGTLVNASLTGVAVVNGTETGGVVTGTAIGGVVTSPPADVTGSVSGTITPACSVAIARVLNSTNYRQVGMPGGAFPLRFNDQIEITWPGNPPLVWWFPDID